MCLRDAVVAVELVSVERDIKWRLTVLALTRPLPVARFGTAMERYIVCSKALASFSDPVRLGKFRERMFATPGICTTTHTKFRSNTETVVSVYLRAFSLTTKRK